MCSWRNLLPYKMCSDWFEKKRMLEDAEFTAAELVGNNGAAHSFNCWQPLFPFVRCRVRAATARNSSSCRQLWSSKDSQENIQYFGFACAQKLTVLKRNTERTSRLVRWFGWSVQFCTSRWLIFISLGTNVLFRRLAQRTPVLMIGLTSSDMGVRNKFHLSF